MQISISNSRQKFTDQPWGLWWIQAQRLTRIELRRNLFSWRASWIYFLAFIPTLIIFAHVVVDAARHGFAMTDDTNVLAGIIQLYYIRLGVFFGCLGIFSRLIRGEMIERSLHFYLLSPVRREVLLIAKFVSGSITAILLFGGAVIADFALMYVGFGAAALLVGVRVAPRRAAGFLPPPAAALAASSWTAVARSSASGSVPRGSVALTPPWLT